MIDHPGGHNHEENWDGDFEYDDKVVGNYGKHPFFCELPKIPNYAPTPQYARNLGNIFFTCEKCPIWVRKECFFSGIPSLIREVARCQLLA